MVRISTFKSSRIRTINRIGPVSCIFSVKWLAGDVKEPTHLSKREGHVVPGVVVYPTFHAWVGWVSEIKYELIAATRSAFTS